VLPVIPALDEDDAIRIANDTIYGLNASVFTSDVNRARQVGARLRSGTVGHNAMRTDFGVSFGGYKQSGIGREGLHEGLQYFLETKFMVLKASRRATRTPACRSRRARGRGRDPTDGRALGPRMCRFASRLSW
jgi:acyl-CoA reductase-like NAD-dependent aldehyde dehydrogenase